MIKNIEGVTVVDMSKKDTIQDNSIQIWKSKSGILEF